MPLKPDDLYLPGSERAYDQVNDRLWRDIVKDPPPCRPCLPLRKHRHASTSHRHQRSSSRAASP
jgi:hypothetical protein